MFSRNRMEVLKLWEFQVNPNDCCFTNKEINGLLKQVDTLKYSHFNSDGVTKIIDMLASEFECEACLTDNPWKSARILGDDAGLLNVWKDQTVLSQYVEIIHDECQDDMVGTITTPVLGHLWEVNEDNPEYLDEEPAQFLHHNCAQLLFLCKQTRP
jgi:hypothetical protein